jgi:hypothetical protein
MHEKLTSASSNIHRNYALRFILLVDYARF